MSHARLASASQSVTPARDPAGYAIQRHATQPATRSSGTKVHPRDGPDSGMTGGRLHSGCTAVGRILAGAWTDVRGSPAPVKPTAARAESSQ